MMAAVTTPSVVSSGKCTTAISECVAFLLRFVYRFEGPLLDRQHVPGIEILFSVGPVLGHGGILNLHRSEYVRS